MLPMMVGLVLILVRVNTAIQVSIVNQQYARMHALWLAFNSPVYPQLKRRERNLTPQGDNQMLIGVSGNQAPVQGDYTPVAATSYVARKLGVHPPGEDSQEADKRASVRIRDTVTLCTQSNVVKAQGSMVPVLPLDPGTFVAMGSFNLTEDPQQFQYCHGGLQYAVDAASSGGT